MKAPSGEGWGWSMPERDFWGGGGEEEGDRKGIVGWW